MSNVEKEVSGKYQRAKEKISNFEIVVFGLSQVKIRLKNYKLRFFCLSKIIEINKETW
jgi:hypothetical protein